MSNFKNELRAWQQVPRDLICDNTLSDRARFVYCFMACKPDNWDFYMKPLADDLGYSVDTLRKYINELEKAGWLTKGDQNHDLEEGKKKKLWGAREYILHAQKVQRESDTENFRHGKNPTQDKRYNRDNRDREKENEEINSSFKKEEKKYPLISDDESPKMVASQPLKAEEQEKEKKNSAKRKESEAGEKTWRNDFDTYLAEVYKAMDELLKDNEYRVLMTSYYPNIDYDKTIDKSVKCYWGTYFGWEQKKKNKRVKNIDMLSTLKKNFDKSKVYKPRSFSKQEQDNDKMYHSKKRDAGSVYHDYAGYGTERYRRFIKWLSDNATYIYEHYTYLITLNQFTEMVKVGGTAERMSEIILALAANPTEYIKYDNLYEFVKEKLHEQR